MGRSCDCCRDECLSYEHTFSYDRYKGRYVSFYDAKEEVYEVTYKQQPNYTYEKFSSNRIDELTKAEAGEDQVFAVCNVFYNARYQDDNLEDFYYNKEEKDESGEDVVNRYRVEYWKKTTVVRKTAIEYTVDDVFDWDKDFIKDIQLYLFGETYTKDAGLVYIYDDFFLGLAGDGIEDKYKISGVITNKIIPRTLNEFEEYLEDTDFMLESNLKSPKITDYLPRKNDTFLFLLEVPEIELKDSITDPVEEQDENFAGPTDVPGAAVIFGLIYDGPADGTQSTDISFLHLQRNGTAAGFNPGNRSDWHDDFTRVAEGEYVSKRPLLNQSINFTPANSPYFWRGGKLKVEIFKEKSDNTKDGFEETYFDETFSFQPDRLNIIEKEALYSQCSYDEDYNRYSDVLQLTNPIDDLQKDFYDVEQEAPYSPDPFDDPPNGKYWVHKLIPKEEIQSKEGHDNAKKIYDRNRELADSLELPDPLYSRNNSPYPRYVWSAKYGDRTMFEALSTYANSSEIISDDPITVPYGDENRFDVFFNEYQDDHNWRISFIVWDCVIETPGSYDFSAGVKSYYSRVPYYGEYKPSKIKITMLDIDNYGMGVSVQELYNPYSKTTVGCPDVSCQLGPNVPDWQIITEEFEGLGSPTTHTLVEHKSDCSSKLTSVKATPLVGSVTYSISHQIKYGVYEPSETTLYRLQAEILNDANELYPNTDGWWRCEDGDFATVEFASFDIASDRINYGPIDSYGFSQDRYDSTQSCCGLKSFQISDGYFISASFGNHYESNNIYRSDCMSYVAGYAGEYDTRFVEDIAFTHDLEVFFVADPYVEAPIDNTFASTHNIYTRLEPFTHGEFSSFDRGELGVTDLVLDTDFFKDENDNPTRTTLRFASFVKDENDEPLTPTYIPGNGLRFRTNDLSYCEKYRSKKDFDILSQEVIPLIVTDIQKNSYDMTLRTKTGAIINLEQDDINEIVGYLRDKPDLKYQYKIEGIWFVENEEGEEFKEIDGESVRGDSFTDPVFCIDSNGNIEGPLHQSFELEKIDDIAVYDEVSIIKDGLGADTLFHPFAGVGPFGECSYGSIEDAQIQLEGSQREFAALCLDYRGGTSYIMGKKELYNDDSIIEYLHFQDSPNTFGSNHFPTPGKRYKTTRDEIDAGFPLVELPETIITDNFIVCPDRTKVEHYTLETSEDTGCISSKHIKTTTKFDGYYAESPEEIGYPINVTVEPPSSLGATVYYSFGHLGGYLLNIKNAQGGLNFSDDAFNTSGYGSYMLEPGKKWDNSYNLISSKKYTENATTEWRDFPISQSTIRLLYKKTVKSDSCGRYLLLDFSSEDLVGYCEDDDDVVHFDYVQTTATQAHLNRDEYIRWFEFRYASAADEYLQELSSLLNSVDYEYTRYTRGYGPFTATRGIDFDNFQAHIYGVDYTFKDAEIEINNYVKHLDAFTPGPTTSIFPDRPTNFSHVLAASQLGLDVGGDYGGYLQRFGRGIGIARYPDDAYGVGNLEFGSVLSEEEQEEAGVSACPPYRPSSLKHKSAAVNAQGNSYGIANLDEDGNVTGYRLKGYGCSPIMAKSFTSLRLDTYKKVFHKDYKFSIYKGFNFGF